MQAKTIEYYDYIKDNKKFTELLELLKDYKNDEERFNVFNDYYELIKTPKTISIKRVKNLWNIIFPVIVSLFLLFVTMIALIALIQNYNTETLTWFLALLFFTIMWLILPYSEIMRSDELHYFNATKYVYNFKNEDSYISFYDIYGFFLTYNRFVDDHWYEFYQLNMVLKDGTVHHIIAEQNNRDELLDDAKTIASYTQKPLYDFQDRKIAKYWRKQ